MAQASGAQREPSMEEILASIRRIIEDSDTAQRKQDETPVAANSAEPARPSAAVVDVEAFRAELRRAPEVKAHQEPAAAAPEMKAQHEPAPAAPEMKAQHEPAPAAPEMKAQHEPAAAAPEVKVHREPPVAAPHVEPEARKPATLAEIQARVARPEDEAQAVPEAASREREPVQLHRSARPSAFAPDGDLDIEMDLQRQVFAGADEPAASADDDRDVHEEAPEKPSAPRTEIISEITSRQVAASFGELSEAFAATRKKSFDEMAEAMLRPMLQDWLDNNLPLLVERLVREEIERVARGVR